MSTDVSQRIEIKASLNWTDAYAERVNARATDLGRPICGAKAKSRGGAPCENAPSPGRDRCRLHGGRTPRGVLSPHYKGRGYSQDLPVHLAERMMEALQDPELTSLGSEIALLDARMGDLLSSLSDKTSRETWISVRKKVKLAHLKVEEERTEDALEFLNDALLALETIRSDQASWEEIYELVELRRKTAKEERAREDQLEATMTARQTAAFFVALRAILEEEIQNPEVRRRIAIRLDKLMNLSPSRNWGTDR